MLGHLTGGAPRGPSFAMWSGLVTFRCYLGRHVERHEGCRSLTPRSSTTDAHPNDVAGKQADSQSRRQVGAFLPCPRQMQDGPLTPIAANLCAVASCQRADPDVSDCQIQEGSYLVGSTRLDSRPLYPDSCRSCCAARTAPRPTGKALSRPETRTRFGPGADPSMQQVPALVARRGTTATITCCWWWR